MNFKIFGACFTFLVCVMALQPVLANEDPDQGACKGEEYRQFDFWLGDWEVFDTKTGEKVGENTIEKVLAGCGIQENWRSVKLSRGRSLNTYDQGHKRWHQTWVDNGGLLLRINGGLDDKGAMVMKGSGFDPRGNEFFSRIRWIPQGDTVRQVWEASSNKGKTWQVLFDGTYRRKVGAD